MSGVIVKTILAYSPTAPVLLNITQIYPYHLTAYVNFLHNISLISKQPAHLNAPPAQIILTALHVWVIKILILHDYFKLSVDALIHTSVI